MLEEDQAKDFIAIFGFIAVVCGVASYVLGIFLFGEKGKERNSFLFFFKVIAFLLFVGLIIVIIACILLIAVFASTL